jgi:TonB family protein
MVIEGGPGPNAGYAEYGQVEAMDWLARCGVVLIVSGSLAPSIHSSALLACGPGQSGDSQQPSAKEPARDADGNYKTGNGVSAPLIISLVDPEFPEAARKKKLGGTCIISAVIDENGTPRNVRVVQSIATGVKKKLQPAALALDNNAVKAVQRYRFRPGTYKGNPVPVSMEIQVEFRIY